MVKHFKGSNSTGVDTKEDKFWIWHKFFGVVGLNNKINVLKQFDVFNDVMQERGLEVHYLVNDSEYNMDYYLSYDIYPECVTLVKSIQMP